MRLVGAFGECLVGRWRPPWLCFAKSLSPLVLSFFPRLWCPAEPRDGRARLRPSPYSGPRWCWFRRSEENKRATEDGDASRARGSSAARAALVRRSQHRVALIGGGLATIQGRRVEAALAAWDFGLTHRPLRFLLRIAHLRCGGGEVYHIERARAGDVARASRARPRKRTRTGQIRSSPVQLRGRSPTPRGSALGRFRWRSGGRWPMNGSKIDDVGRCLPNVAPCLGTACSEKSAEVGRCWPTIGRIRGEMGGYGRNLVPPA